MVKVNNRYFNSNLAPYRLRINPFHLDLVSQCVLLCSRLVNATHLNLSQIWPQMKNLLGLNIKSQQMNQGCNLSLVYYLSTSWLSLDDTAWQTVICIVQNRFDVTAFSHLDSQKIFFPGSLEAGCLPVKYPKEHVELLKMKCLHYRVSEKWKYKNNQVANVINKTVIWCLCPQRSSCERRLFCFLDVVFELVLGDDKCFCVVPSPHPAYFLPSWKGINLYTTSLTLRFTQHWQWIKCFLPDRTQRVSIDEWVYTNYKLRSVRNPLLCVHRQHLV